MFRGESDPDTAGNFEKRFLVPQAVLQQRQQSSRFFLRLFSAAGILQKNRKFISADSADDIRFRKFFLHCRRKFGQDGISEHMSHSVVQMFEIIDVQHQKRAGRVRRATVQIFLDQRTGGYFIIKTRQRVFIRLFSQFFYKTPFFIDVCKQPDRFQRFAGGIILKRNFQPAPDRISCRIDQSELFHQAAFRLLEFSGKVGEEGPVFRIDVIEKRLDFLHVFRRFFDTELLPAVRRV